MLSYCNILMEVIFWNGDWIYLIIHWKNIRAVVRFALISSDCTSYVDRVRVIKKKYGLGFPSLLFNFIYLNRPFPNLTLLKILLFRLYFRKFLNGYLPLKNISFQNFKPIFSVILRIFDLKCHGQTSLKVTFLAFGLIFMNFRKLESFHRENKKFDWH